MVRWYVIFYYYAIWFVLIPSSFRPGTILDLIQRNIIEFGFKGFMADFGEYTPIDAVAVSEPSDPYEFHNLLPVLWASTVRYKWLSLAIKIISFPKSPRLPMIICSDSLWNKVAHWIQFFRGQDLDLQAPNTFIRWCGQVIKTWTGQSLMDYPLVLLQVFKMRSAIK